MKQAADILTVALSLPAVLMCLMVIRHWMPQARRAVRQRRDAADWLILGVTISFAGVAANMTWWAVYWLSRVWDHASQAWLLDTGSIVNLFSRQGAVIAAAYCHLKAYQTFRATPGVIRPETLLLLGLAASGIAFTAILILVEDF